MGLFLLILAGSFVYLSHLSAKKKVAVSTKQVAAPADTGIVNSFAESCLKMVSEEALFRRTGLQGGYIYPSGNTEYREEAVNPPPASFSGNKVPYFIQATRVNGFITYNKFVPTLDAISKKLANYVAVEFEKCFKSKVFEDIGLDVNSTASAKIIADINSEDVSVRLDYPLIIKTHGKESRLDTFAVKLPIRLKALYDSAAELVQEIENSGSDAYTITSNDCKSFDKNGLTNVYVQNSDSGTNKIVQFVDYSTYGKHYTKSYTFQFAVKNINVNGNCVG